MNVDPIKKLIEIKERAKGGIEDSLFFIKDVESKEKKGILTKEDSELFKKRYNNAIRDYKENIRLIDLFFEKEEN